MKIKLKTLVNSESALDRLFKSHGPTSNDTFVLGQLRRAVFAHIGPESAYREAQQAAEVRYTVYAGEGARMWVGANDAERLASMKARNDELSPVWEKEVELDITLLTLAQLDTLKMPDHKPLALSVEEIDALAWLIAVPKS